MDFYVAVATVSPVLLLALASSWKGQLAVLPWWGRFLAGAFVLLPALVSIVVSLAQLRAEDGGGWLRGLVLITITSQVSASLLAIGGSMWTTDTSDPEISAAIAERDQQWTQSMKKAVKAAVTSPHPGGAEE